MVERLSVSGRSMGGGSRMGGPAKPKKLLHCNGLGGNPSSLATKKAGPNKKPPSSNIFAAQTPK